MLLLGQFNYGKSGILDKTHTRLFTKKTIEKLIESTNYKIIKERGIPIPFPLIVDNKFISKCLLATNNFLIRILKKLFSFQYIYVIEVNPSLDYLIKNAYIGNKIEK